MTRTTHIKSIIQNLTHPQRLIINRKIKPLTITQITIPILRYPQLATTNLILSYVNLRKQIKPQFTVHDKKTTNQKQNQEIFLVDTDSSSYNNFTCSRYHKYDTFDSK